LGVGSSFQILHDRIITPGGGVVIFVGVADATAESIKSLEGFRIAWIKEAQTLRQRSLSLLRPTIRAEGSQIWACWNPRRKSDAVDEFLRAKKPDNATVVQANWRDNPWFPPELEKERQLDLELYPERYQHTWEGAYASAFEGAYFAKQLEQARQQGRICRVSVDPILPVRAFFDIGGAGSKSDAMAIWVSQSVNREIRLLDYIEGQGQPLGFYATELRRRGWKDAIVVLPHDGVATNNVSGRRYIDHWRDAGFECEAIKNTGAGAAMMRVRIVILMVGPPHAKKVPLDLQDRHCHASELPCPSESKQHYPLRRRIRLNDLCSRGCLYALEKLLIFLFLSHRPLHPIRGRQSDPAQTLTKLVQHGVTRL